jgi:hypothetical protein
MTKTLVKFLVLIIIFASCKVTETNFVGSYSMDKVPKTTFTFNSDKTFSFTRINTNPYLHPFDHPDEYHFTTKGNWGFVDKNIVEIVSQVDTVIYPLVTIDKSNPQNDSTSKFNFIDVYGDKVKILYVQKTDSSIVAALHRSMDFFSCNLKKEDTLEFHFYGYLPYKFVGGQQENSDYLITLRPYFKPNFFFRRQFKVTKNKIRDIKVGVDFKRKKSGI